MKIIHSREDKKSSTLDLMKIIYSREDKKSSYSRFDENYSF